MTFKKTLLALALLSSSAAFAQTTSYSSATFNWQKSITSPVASTATSTVTLHQAVDGVLSASGGVTFSAGTAPVVRTAADARETYKTFANDVYGLVQTNVTAIRTAVDTYNALPALTRSVNAGAETLTVGGSYALDVANPLHGSRVGIQSAMNTLNTNIGTANSALATARSAISSESNLHIDGNPAWTQMRANSLSLAVGFYRVVDAAGNYSYWEVVNNANRTVQSSISTAASEAQWITVGVLNAPVAQFQQHARQF